MADPQIINLDIGGIKFRTVYSTLTSVPNCKLATYLERWTEGDTQDIFIDRDGRHFVYILNYLRNGGSAVLPKDTLVLEELKSEADFYKLPGLVQLIDKKVSAGGGCRQVDEGSELVGGQGAERVGAAASSAGVNQPVQQQNGDILVPKDETEGKCGVLQYSDHYMTDVWMCPQCYCTIALPQQQTAAVVGGGGSVSKRPEQMKLVVADKTTRKKSRSPGPGPSKPTVKSSARKKPAVQRGRKRTPPTHRHQSTASVKTNGGNTEPVYKCKKCDRCYGKECMLKTHMKTKHTITPHQCNTCAKCFASAQSLRQHIDIIHNSAKPFQCTQCKLSFCRKSSLITHIRSIHEGQSFICETCGRKFVRKCNLTQHALVHSAEKPYICEICGNRFTQSTGLAQHRRRHLQVKSHHCPKCHMKFITAGELKQHARYVHPMHV